MEHLEALIPLEAQGGVGHLEVHHQAGDPFYEVGLVFGDSVETAVPPKFIRLRPEAFDELHVVAPIEQWTISAVVQIHEADSSLR